MAKTNLQKRASYYERIIREARKSPYSPKYHKVCNALKDLVEISNKINDSSAILSEKEYSEITKHYAAAQKACMDYLSEQDKFNNFEKQRKGIVSELSSVLLKDTRALKGYDPLKPATLSQLVEQSRTATIFINSNEIKTVGGNVNRRIPMKTSNGKKGFFTPKRVFNYDATWREKFAPYEKYFESVSAKSKDAIERLKTDGKFQMDVCLKFPHAECSIDNVKVGELAYILGMTEKEDEGPNLQKNNPELYGKLDSFLKSLIPMLFQYRFMHDVGIEVNSNISSRNCAMSDVARLLGCNDLLAKSSPVKIVIDGVETEGVFMEAVEGSDINHMKENDLLFDATGDSLESTTYYKQLADLQVLDYICGNTDRHTGNMIYNFYRDEKGKVHLAGVKGIDNDSSFGVPTRTAGRQLMYMVDPEDMMYITSSMAAKLNSITKEMLQMELMGNDLSEKEIDAAWDRLNNVKDAVEKGVIQIKTPEDWEKFTLDGEEIAPENYFSNAKELQFSCTDKEYKKKYEENKEELGEVSYVNGKHSLNMAMASKKTAILNLREKMNNAKAIFYDTAEYTAMKTRFEAVDSLTNQLAECMENNSAVPDNLTDNLKKAYVDLMEKTERYIALKKLVPSQERGQKRLEFANSLLNFAQESLDEMSAGLEKGNENEVEENKIEDAGIEMQ